MVVDSHMGVKHRYDPKIASVIFSLASGGVPSPGIIYTVGLTWPTILKFYRDALHAGRAMAEKKIATKVFTLALKANSEAVALNAAQFWLKTQAGWKETTVIETNHMGQQAVATITEDMTDEQAAEAYALMRTGATDEIIEGDMVEDAEAPETVPAAPFDDSVDPTDPTDAYDAEWSVIPNRDPETLALRDPETLNGEDTLQK